MAINPLQQPINYGAIAPQVNISQQFAEFGKVLVDRQNRIQAEKVKEEYKTDLQAALANPTQETWSNMIAKYPQQREAFAEVRKQYGEVAVRNESNMGMEVSMALENNNPEVATAKLMKIISALENSGRPTGAYKQALNQLELGDTKGAQAGVNLALAFLDPDNFKKIVDARTAAAKAPSDLLEAQGKAQKALSDAAASLAAADNAQAKAKAEADYELAKSQKERADADVAAETVAARIAEGVKVKLAPSVQESIDYANLTTEQKATFDTLQILKKPPAAVTEIKITNLEKTSQDQLGKLVPDLYEQANSAVTQVQDIPRYRTALQNAIVGPLANARLTANQIGEFLGFTGDKRINATRELIQGLAEMALKSRSMLTGQGSITEGEQALLLKARSGDISFTKGELDIIFNVADRAARAQYEKSTNLLRSASTKSETAQMFLDNVKAMPEAQLSPNTVKVGDMTYTRPANFTDKQWADYKQNVGAK